MKISTFEDFQALAASTRAVWRRRSSGQGCMSLGDIRRHWWRHWRHLRPWRHWRHCLGDIPQWRHWRHWIGDIGDNVGGHSALVWLWLGLGFGGLGCSAKWPWRDSRDWRHWTRDLYKSATLRVIHPTYLTYSD